MTRRFYVYTITHVKSGKVYVGKSVDPIARWSGHKWQAKSGHVTRVHRAMRKYGVDAFRLNVLAGFPVEEDAFAFEIELIARLWTRDRQVGYNSSAGGEGPSGVRPTAAARQKMSAPQKARIARDGPAVMTPEIRAKIASALTGRKIGPTSEAAKQKLRAKAVGRKFGPEVRAKVSAARRSRVAAPTPAMLAQRNGPLKGIKHDAVARANHSEAMRKRWRDGGFDHLRKKPATE